MLKKKELEIPERAHPSAVSPEFGPYDEDSEPITSHEEAREDDEGDTKEEGEGKEREVDATDATKVIELEAKPFVSEEEEKPDAADLHDEPEPKSSHISSVAIPLDLSTLCPVGEEEMEEKEEEEEEREEVEEVEKEKEEADATIAAAQPHPELDAHLEELKTKSSLFRQHLEHDIYLLSQALGRSMDECSLLVHCILKKIVVDPPAEGE